MHIQKQAKNRQVPLLDSYEAVAWCSRIRLCQILLLSLLSIKNTISTSASKQVHPGSLAFTHRTIVTYVIFSPWLIKMGKSMRACLKQYGAGSAEDHSIQNKTKQNKTEEGREKSHWKTNQQNRKQQIE